MQNLPSDIGGERYSHKANRLPTLPKHKTRDERPEPRGIEKPERLSNGSLLRNGNGRQGIIDEYEKQPYELLRNHNNGLQHGEAARSSLHVAKRRIVALVPDQGGNGGAHGGGRDNFLMTKGGRMHAPYEEYSHQELKTTGVSLMSVILAYLNFLRKIIYLLWFWYLSSGIERL